MWFLSIFSEQLPVCSTQGRVNRPVCFSVPSRTTKAKEMIPCFHVYHTHHPLGKGYITPPPPDAWDFFTGAGGYRGLLHSPQYLCAGTLAPQPPGAEVIAPSNPPGPSNKGASPLRGGRKGAGGLGPLLPGVGELTSKRINAPIN